MITTNITNIVFQDSDIINSYFYFYSTIAQVLAGIIALFGVFILFRIKQINELLCGQGKALLIEYYDENKKLKDGRDVIYQKLENVCYPSPAYIFERIRKALARKDVKDINYHFLHLAKAEKTDSFIRDYTNYKKLLKEKSILFFFTIGAIILSILIIIFSTIYIRSANLISNNYLLMNILFSFNLILIGYIIIYSIRINKSYTGDWENYKKQIKKPFNK